MNRLEVTESSVERKQKTKSIKKRSAVVWSETENFAYLSLHDYLHTVDRKDE